MVQVVALYVWVPNATWSAVKFDAPSPRWSKNFLLLVWNALCPALHSCALFIPIVLHDSLEAVGLVRLSCTSSLKWTGFFAVRTDFLQSHVLLCMHDIVRHDAVRVVHFYQDDRMRQDALLTFHNQQVSQSSRHAENGLHDHQFESNPYHTHITVFSQGQRVHCAARRTTKLSLQLRRTVITHQGSRRPSIAQNWSSRGGFCARGKPTVRSAPGPASRADPA